MTTPNTPTPHLPDHRLRVSDAEREVVASRLRDAAMEGRLTMTEVTSVRRSPTRPGPARTSSP